MKVAGVWGLVTQHEWARISPDGKVPGQVMEAGGVYCGLAEGQWLRRIGVNTMVEFDGPTYQHVEFETLGEAQAAVDEVLRHGGWLLVD